MTRSCTAHAIADHAMLLANCSYPGLTVLVGPRRSLTRLPAIVDRRHRTGAARRSGKPTVALVVKTLNNPFFIEMQRGAEEAAKQARRRPGRAGGGARSRRRAADADHREPDPGAGQRARAHAERVARGRSRRREGEPGEHPGRDRRHAARRARRARDGRREDRQLRRLGQLRRRPVDRASSW